MAIKSCTKLEKWGLLPGKGEDVWFYSKGYDLRSFELLNRKRRLENERDSRALSPIDSAIPPVESRSAPSSYPPWRFTVSDLWIEEVTEWNTDDHNAVEDAAGWTSTGGSHLNSFRSSSPNRTTKKKMTKTLGWAGLELTRNSPFVWAGNGLAKEAHVFLQIGAGLEPIKFVFGPTGKAC